MQYVYTHVLVRTNAVGLSIFCVQVRQFCHGVYDKDGWETQLVESDIQNDLRDAIEVDGTLLESIVASCSFLSRRSNSKSYADLSYTLQWCPPAKHIKAIWLVKKSKRAKIQGTAYYRKSYGCSKLTCTRNKYIYLLEIPSLNIKIYSSTSPTYPL